MATQTSPVSTKQLVKPPLTPNQTDGEAESNIDRVNESSLQEVRHFSTAETLAQPEGYHEAQNSSESQQKSVLGKRLDKKSDTDSSSFEGAPSET